LRFGFKWLKIHRKGSHDYSMPFLIFWNVWKMFYYPKIAPNFMSHLPILSFFEQNNTQRNKFEAEIWRRWLCSTLLATLQRISKNNLLYVGWKSTKWASFYLHFEICKKWFCWFFWWMTISIKFLQTNNFFFNFQLFSYFFLIKTSKYVFSWDFALF